MFIKQSVWNDMASKKLMLLLWVNFIPFFKFQRMFRHVKRKLNVAKNSKNGKKCQQKFWRIGEKYANSVKEFDTAYVMWVCRDCRFLNFDDHRVFCYSIQVHSPLQNFLL